MKKQEGIGMKRNEKMGEKKEWNKTGLQYPSPSQRGRYCVESRRADLAARMAKTTLLSNPGDLDWNTE